MMETRKLSFEQEELTTRSVILFKLDN